MSPLQLDIQALRDDELHGQTSLVLLGLDRYPKTSRYTQDPDLSADESLIDAWLEARKAVFLKIDGRRFLLRKNGEVSTAAKTTAELDLERHLVLKKIRWLFKTAVGVALNEAPRSRHPKFGIYPRKRLRETPGRLEISVEQILHFLSKVPGALTKTLDDETLERYGQLPGFLELAGEMDGVHLKMLFDLAYKLGLTEQLNWPYISAPYQVAKDFVELCADHERRSHLPLGNPGIEQTARELGLHRRQLHSLASAVMLGSRKTVAEKLDWRAHPNRPRRAR